MESSAKIQGPAASAPGAESDQFVSSGAAGADSAIVFFDNSFDGQVGLEARRVRIFGLVACVVILLGAPALGAAYAFPGTFAPLLGLAAGALGLLAWRLSTRPDAALRQRAEALTRPITAQGRVRCNARPRSLAPILGMDPLCDQMFEPRIFRGIASVSSWRPRKTAQLCIFMVLCAGIVFLQIKYWRHGGNVYVELMGAIALSALLASLLLPTYLRVVPGRLDILECGILGRRIISSTRIDLRTSQVLVDLKRQIVEVKDGNRTTVVAFGAVWDRWALAHSVLMAAISTHTPPPLPDDALLG